MTSNRHKKAGRPGRAARGAPEDGGAGAGGATRARTAQDAVLDAARDCVLAVGVRRTTLTDIARRAGESRMTLYRRWPELRTVGAGLMPREWTAPGPPLPPPD